MTISNEQITLLFMKRFNCAAHRIREPSLISSDCSQTRMAGLVPQRTTSRTWKLNPTAGFIHPFVLMLHGTPCRSTSAIRDLEHIYTIPGSMETFRQGFSNASDFKDSWGGLEAGREYSEEYYYYSLYFNLGRVFLHKFCKVDLPRKLPATIRDIFNKLK